MSLRDDDVTMFALCLTCLAGGVDAIGFLQLGGYFVSFMSGNSTRMAVGLIQGQWRRVALSGVTILIFVIGAGFGMATRNLAHPPVQAAAVLSLVAALLAAAAICHTLEIDTPAVVMMTMAMGAENAALRSDKHTIGVTYVTGTLAKVGQRLVNALMGKKEDASWFPRLMLWLGLITGGVIGTVLFNAIGLSSLWVAAGWAACLAFAGRRVREE